MTEDLNSVSPPDVSSIIRQRKLHTSNKISKGTVGRSLRQPARPLLGTILVLFPTLAGPTLARLAGGSL
jgi:hypothetical protein